MKENDIRPDFLMIDESKTFGEDIVNLIRYQDEFVIVNCPACDSDNFTFVFKKHNIQYVQCNVCKTMFVNPRPTQKILNLFYSTSKGIDYWNKFIFPATENTRKKNIFMPRVKHILQICKKYNISTGTLMDVGAGFGTFCEILENIKIFRRVIAVEPSPTLANTCKIKGLDVIETPIEDVTLELECVDVIVSFEVIEHLFRPFVFLERCKFFLKKGGILVVTCPNVEGFDILTLKDRSDNTSFPHLNFFNPQSIALLVERCGFEVLEVITPGELDAELVRKKVLSGAYDISSQSFLKQILIDDWDRLGIPFQKFLADNNLSSHMWLVAQKK